MKKQIKKIKKTKIQEIAEDYVILRDLAARAAAKLEPLARSLRQHGGLVSVEVSGKQYKIQIIENMRATLDVHAVREVLGGEWVESHSTHTSFKSIHVAEVKS